MFCSMAKKKLNLGVKKRKKIAKCRILDFENFCVKGEKTKGFFEVGFMGFEVSLYPLVGRHVVYEPKIAERVGGHVMGEPDNTCA